MLAVVFVASCSVSRFVPEGAYILDKTSIQSDSSLFKTNGLNAFVRQHPNSKWFNLFKVPMLPYMLSSTDSAKAINRFLWRIGEAPVIEDTLLTERCVRDIQMAVHNMGYLDADVSVERKYHKHKVELVYHIDPKTRYTIGLMEREVKDSALLDLISKSDSSSLLREGIPFDVNTLDAERSRINSILVNNGYYQFNKDHIRFEADTTEAPLQAWVKMIVDPYRASQNATPVSHRRYKIGHVSYVTPEGDLPLRQSVLDRSNHIVEGSYYNEHDMHSTYNAFGMLDALLTSSIRMDHDPVDSTLLNPVIRLIPTKPNSFSAELEGTNSAGDLGAAAVVSYQNNNVFRGSETFVLKARGAFENIRGLDGYEDQNFIEYSIEGSLKFPDFIFPFLDRDFRRSTQATSEVAVTYDSQNRPEFHRRVVSAAWRYRWLGKGKRFRHRVDLIDLNYVYMPWISTTFKNDYLDNPNSRNAILRYNYENLFIMKLGYNLSFSTLAAGMTSSYGTNAYSIRFAIESAGNLLNAISKLAFSDKKGAEYYKVFSIAYAQYAKMDFDFAKSFRINDRNSIALHAGLGVALPYGNSHILPYEKRYFSGGANSVRGWSVRSLGPGRFKGSDGRIDFINQTGDIKLDLNAEYRTHLFWKVDGAVFVDAGNIWTFRDYDDQPGGQFLLSTFWKQIAMAYGVGLRFNFNYFILRFDGGMKAINPAYDDSRSHFPLLHPSFSRDFAFHFAVGLPF